MPKIYTYLLQINCIVVLSKPVTFEESFHGIFCLDSDRFSHAEGINISVELLFIITEFMMILLLL